VGPFYLSTGRVIHFAFSSITALGLALFLYRTYLGKAIRAIIQNRDAVKIVGIDPNRISSIAFGIGLMLVGMTGALIPLTFPGITPGMGASYTLVAFVVIVLGGLGNPMGSIIGGLIFGLTENISTLFLPLALSPVISFFILILIIMIRAQGFLGGTGT
jgi:branched-chain amino acid transport system permease protein